MPHKFNEARRHKFEKKQYRIAKSYARKLVMV